MPPNTPVYRPLRNWSYQVTGGEEPWAISPNLTNLPALSDSERAGLMDAQYGGDRSPFLQEAEGLGYDIGSIIANPAIAHSAVADVRAASPTAPNTPKRRERVGLGEASELTWQALEDGVIETKISRIGYDAWRGSITREEALAGVAQLRSQMHDPNNDQQYGAALKAVTGAAGIVGQMAPSLRKGLLLGAASATAVAPMGAATGPFSPWTVPALAGSAFTVGATSGIMTSVSEEATGRFYLDLISQEYEMWPDLDNPGGYLSQPEYEIKRATEKRYTTPGGYAAEIATIPDNIAKSLSIGVGASIGGLELAQVGMLSRPLRGVLKKTRLGEGLGQKAVARLIESRQLAKFARVQAAKIATVGTQEIGIEMVQGGVEFAGAALAGELNSAFNNANIPLGEQEEFFRGIGETMIRTAREVSAPMFILAAVPGTTGGAVQWTMGRREATAKEAQRVRTLDGTTAGYFEQSTGEDVTISDIGVEETELIERDKVIAASILEVASTSDVKLQPITVEVRPDGTLFATDPSAAAVTQVMRDAGAKSLRVVKRDVSRGPVDAIPPWEAFADTDVEAQIANQFPDDTVAEVRAKMVPLRIAAMRDNVSVTEWVDQHFQDGMLFRQPEVPAAPEALLALPEPTAPAAPTVDAAVFESIRMPDEALPPMARPEVIVEPEVPAPPTVEGVAQAQIPGIEEIPDLPEVAKEPTAPPSPIVETEAIAPSELEATPEVPAIVIEPRAAPAPVVELRRSWRRRAFAMGRVIDELEFGWQSGEWKTASGWLEDSGLSGVVTTQEMTAKLGTDNVVPADAFGHALRETMAQELLPPKEMVPPLSEAPEPTIEPALPALPEATALQLREPGVAEFAPRAPEATLEPPIPAAPLAPPGPPTVAPPLPPVPPMEFADAMIEDLDDAVEKELASEQLRRMRAAEQGADTPIPAGPVMSSKTYLIAMEADALKAADAFLAKAAKNTRMDMYEDTSGGYRTPPEHAALLSPVVEQERIRLETEAARLVVSSKRDLTRQMKREQREAALAREVEGELEPTEAEAPDIEDVPYHEGSVPRPELMPAFDTSIPVDARPVIYVDMEEKPVILSGLSAYNSAAPRAGQAVEGTILRADEGVALEEAKEFAIRRGQEEPGLLPDDIPAVPVERVAIKSDGEEVGAVEFDRQGRAILETYDSTDFKSWVHGLSHVFRRMLPAREEAIAARWAGVSSIRQSSGRLEWAWNEDADYRFASGFEQYLREGRVRATELQPIWKRLSEWTKASYAGNSARLNRRVRNVYESLLVDEKSPALKSYRSNIQMVGQVGQMVFRSPTSAYLLRLSATGGRDLTEQNLPPGPDRVRVEAMRQDGEVVLAREYKNLESAVRDISGVPSTDYPATVGDGSFRPFRAKRGANGGFNGPGPPGDPSALSPEVGPEGSVYVGDRAVDGNVFIADVIDRLDRLGPLHQSKLSKRLTSWRKYDYLTELLSSGVDGSLFQLLSRDMDTGRAAEKGLRYDLHAMLRDKLLRRGWSERDVRNLPRAMKEEVTVAGWKHAGAMKDPWTVGKLLSFNRHLRAGQNRATLLSRGFRDGPDGEIVNVDEGDIKVLAKAVGTLPEHVRDFGTEVVDELMDVIHERQDAVHRKARRRTLGYVPNYWDLERSQKDRTQATVDEEMEQADAIDRWRGQSDSKLGIYEGMTYHRTQKSAPVVLRPLDFQLLRNIDRASMYVGFELPLQAAAKLFDNAQAVAAMEERMDKSSVQGIKIGLEGIARRWIDEQNIDLTAAKIQRGVTVATLGGNIGVWVKQTLSLPLYGVYVPGKYMAASLQRASVEGEFSQMRDKLKAFDPTFQARSRGFDISLQGALEKTAAGEAWGKRRVSDLMMKGIGFFDQRTVVVGSHAAYLQAIDEFRTGLISEEVKRATDISSHAEAVALGPDGQAFKAYRYANWITYRTQPNFLPEHVSSFQRHKITRFLSMFSGYTNMTYNLMARTMWRAKQTKSKADIQAMRKAFMWIFVGNTAGVMIIDFLNQIVRGTAPKEDELPSWAARKVITSVTAPIYILRDAAYAFTNPYGPTMAVPLTAAASQIMDGMRSFSEDLVNGELRESTIKKLVTAAGIGVGMPAGHLYRYTTGIMDLFDPMSQ